MLVRAYVIGAKEVEDGTVSVRSRETGETEVMTIEDFVQKGRFQLDRRKV